MSDAEIESRVVRLVVRVSLRKTILRQRNKQY